MAFIVAENAERRIGEPDRVVGLHYHVVRRVERFAVELVDQHGDVAVVFGASDAATIMLAGDQPTLAVARIAICVVRWLAEHAYPPSLLVPAHDAIVGNIAPQQATGVAEIDRALAPAHVGRDALDAGEGQAITCKARVKDLDRRIRIALARLPAAEGCAGDRHRGNRAGAETSIPRLVICIGFPFFVATALRGRLPLHPSTVSLRLLRPRKCLQIGP